MGSLCCLAQVRSQAVAFVFFQKSHFSELDLILVPDLISSLANMASKPEVVLQNEEEYFSIKVPNWPYESWELQENTEVQEDITEQSSSPMHSVPASVGPVFSSFLNSFSRHLGILRDSTSTSILNQVTNMLNDSLCELGKSYKCFEKYQLVQAGSVAEKTKVETVDEFDFLVIMEYFADEELFKTVVGKNMVRIYVNDPTVAELLPIECQTHSVSKDFLAVTLRAKFMELFMEIFDVRLPSGWRRVVGEDKQPCGSSIASTIHLIYEKCNLNIDVDLCLCLPIKADDFQGVLSLQNVDPLYADSWKIQTLLFRYLSNVMRQSSLEVFAILGRSNSAFEVIDTRITAPSLELFYFQSFPPDDGRIKTYCIAKCILSAFLPKLSTIFGCKRCCHRLVKSYHIKNVLLFMLKNYKEDSFWEEDKVPMRVLEIFSILEQCMVNFEAESPDSSYDAAVSTCCLPGTLYLENITNSSPYNTEGADAVKYFFSPDSHKPLYELSSSSPVYEQQLATGNEEADSLLQKWFKDLNDKPWNSKQLLHELVNLLKEINKIVQ